MFALSKEIAVKIMAKTIPINIIISTHIPKPQPKGREVKKLELSETDLDFKFFINFSLLSDSNLFLIYPFISIFYKGHKKN